MKKLDVFSHLLASKYYIAPTILSLITIYILSGSYSSTGGFDMRATFYNFTVFISTILTVFLANSIFQGKKELSSLFNLSVLSMILNFFWHIV